ncbi:MAG: imidazole glycerol phosphate synthase subunit HisH [Bacteroidia bacterium]
MDLNTRKIAIIDYGMGNIRSVKRKFNELGFEAEGVSNPDYVMNADKLVLPGVGHFAQGVKNLKSSGLWEVIYHKVINENTPVLGICLGLQLMARHSEEGDAEGFGWLDAEVVRFNINNSLKFKVPHIGWNSCELTNENPFTSGLKKESLYYFVHSYHLNCRNEAEIIGTSSYETNFVSIAGRNHIIGVQFHPEKSHDAANVLINNFARYQSV